MKLLASFVLFASLVFGQLPVAVPGSPNGGGTGCIVSGTDGSLQFKSGSGCGGSANLTWDGTTFRVGPTGTMFVGPDESSLDSSIQGYVGTAE